jgi:hypothetical protein
VVGVLEFVDEHVREAPDHRVTKGIVSFERTHGAVDQITEVESIGLLKPFFVGRVHAAYDLGPGVRRLDVGRPLDFLLGTVDPACHCLGLISLLVETQIAKHALHQRQLILVVVDREILRKPQALSVAPEQPGACRVKRPYLNGSPLLAEQTQQTLAHLAGRLVGEGDRENSPRRHVVRGDQVRDTKRDHAGLAASGAGKDHERPPLVNDCLALTRIQRAQVQHRLKVAPCTTKTRQKPGL